MSQFDFGTIDPNTKSGTQLSSDLNDFRDALNSGHSGATRPVYAQAGTHWVRTVSSTQWDLVFYDGTADYTLRSVNPTTSTLLQIPKEDVEGLEQAITDVASAVLKDTDANNTGAALIPSGTTAQRPGTPTPGMWRHNATLSEMERYQGGQWLPMNIADKAFNEAPIVTLASAATVDIGAAAANTISISGSVTITSLGTIASGARRTLVFQSTPLITHNATSLILPGGSNITATAGDVAEFVSLGSGNWRCIQYQKSSSIGGITLGTAQNTTSGTFFDFTGIPAGVNRVTISFDSVSTNGSTHGLVQLGSGSMQTSGYSSAGAVSGGTNLSTGYATTIGFLAPFGLGPANTGTGAMVLTRLTGNKWVASVAGGFPNTLLGSSYGGVVTLSGQIDRLRITTITGADSFDGGSINIMYE